jgi:hypothetical protein
LPEFLAGIIKLEREKKNKNLSYETMSKTPRQYLYDLNEKFGTEKYPLPAQYVLKTKWLEDEFGINNNKPYKMYQAMVAGYLPVKQSQYNRKKDTEKAPRYFIEHYSELRCEIQEAENIAFEDWLTFCNTHWNSDVDNSS